MNVDKLDIDEIVTVRSSLNSLNSKVDNLDIDKSKTLPIDLKRIK